MKLESQHTHWPAATPKHHLHRWTYTLCLGRLLGGHSAGYFTELSLTGMATQALSGSVKLDLGFTCPTQQHIPKDHQALRIHPTGTTLWSTNSQETDSPTTLSQGFASTGTSVLVVLDGRLDRCGHSTHDSLWSPSACRTRSPITTSLCGRVKHLAPSRPLRSHPLKAA